MLLHDAQLAAQRLLATAGVPVEVQVSPAQIHVFQLAAPMIPKPPARCARSAATSAKRPVNQGTLRPSKMLCGGVASEFNSGRTYTGPGYGSMLAARQPGTGWPPTRISRRASYRSGNLGPGRHGMAGSRSGGDDGCRRAPAPACALAGGVVAQGHQSPSDGK